MKLNKISYYIYTEYSGGVDHFFFSISSKSYLEVLFIYFIYKCNLIWYLSLLIIKNNIIQPNVSHFRNAYKFEVFLEVYVHSAV